MNKKRRYLIAICFVSILIATAVRANALTTGLKANSVTDEEKSQFLSNCEILFLGEEPIRKPICCFDVNSNQQIAVGQEDAGRRKTVCVYSSEGIFQYGYTFNCSGTFGVEWDAENLNIYYVRGAMLVSLTPKGEVLDVLQVQDTKENNAYIRDTVFGTKKQIGSTEYSLGNNFGLFNLFTISYSRVIVRDAAGVESVIYDVSETQLLSTIVTIVVACLFVSVTVMAIAQRIAASKKGKGGQGDGSIVP